MSTIKNVLSTRRSLDVAKRAHVCPECKKIVSGEYGHDSTCESREDPAGPVVKNW